MKFDYEAIEAWQAEDPLSRSVSINIQRAHGLCSAWMYDYSIGAGASLFAGEPFFVPDLVEVKRRRLKEELAALG